MSDFFAASLAEFKSADAPGADVSIDRSAELIRADRDGRTDTA